MEDVIEKCKKVLIKYENILFAYIFGSYASGRVREDSDIDIAIYLKEKIDTKEYLDIRMDLMEACGRKVDLIILSKATPLLKFEVYRNNILLFTRDETLENNFKVKTLFEYWDTKKYLDMAYKKNIERIKQEAETSG
ncbi:MAG: nucleotidyltransferase domain-containing protein [Clostridiaceae bacterium]|nr:nucleotidyltransferase domain-containing protein [Clostridiaceae bacterium]